MFVCLTRQPEKSLMERRMKERGEEQEGGEERNEAALRCSSSLLRLRFTLSVSTELCLRRFYNPSPDEKMRARWQRSHSNGISFPQGVEVQNKFII